MTTGIKNLVDQFIVEHGRSGKARLCQAIEKSENTLNRWLKDGIPTAHDAYTLALACGCDRSAALQLAMKEALPTESIETA